MKKTNLASLILGIFIGISILNPLAQAAENWLKATPSAQKFFVNGKQVALEAYAIEGHNYVKLRDVGAAVGFSVDYDAAADSVYIGQRPGQTDYSAQANPAIFTGELTREAYNAIRSSLLSRDEILAGTAVPVSFQADLSYDSQLRNAAAMLGQYPKYSLNAFAVGQYRCDVQELEVYAPAVEHTQSFVDSLNGLNQREQAAKIAWYVCDRLTYAIEYPFVDEVLSQDGQVRGCCMAYAYCFQFLCDRAGIPCILTSSSIHQWNQVYIDGRWWAVDVTGLDVGNDVNIRPDLKVLKEFSDLYGENYRDGDPQTTAFTKELLAPGSTK